MHLSFRAFVTAIAVVVITAIMVSPKWLDWWLRWKKWKHAQPVSETTSGGTSTSQTLISRPRRYWQRSDFWLMVVDLLLSSGSSIALLMLMSVREPVTVGWVAMIVLAGAFLVIGTLRRW